MLEWLECRDFLQKLGTRNSIKIVWVPGYEDIAGNEIAAELQNHSVVYREVSNVKF